MTYIFNGFKDIGEALVKDLGIWWFLVPLLILWFGSQIYYGEYKKERISFAGAFSSGLSFTWINISTLRFLFLEPPQDIWLRFYILIIFLLYGLFLIINAFSHRIPQEQIEIFANPNVIYPLSIMVILFGQGYLAVDLFVILNLLIIFSIIGLFFIFLKRKILGLRGEVEAIKAGELPKEIEKEKAKILKI